MQITDTVYGFFWESMTQNNCNTYLIDGPTRILIDPGHLKLFDHVTRGLEAIGLGVEDIGLVLCTHAHPDHIEAVQVFSDLSAMKTIHEKDWRLVRTMIEHLGGASRLSIESVRPDFFLDEGDFSVGGMDFKVFHTPGHSPGEICLYWPEKKVLFSGDLIFKGGLGRTDLPGGDGKRLKESIRRMSDLDIEYILPGHGGHIVGKEAVRRNFKEIETYWFSYV